MLNFSAEELKTSLKIIAASEAQRDLVPELVDGLMRWRESADAPDRMTFLRHLLVMIWLVQNENGQDYIEDVCSRYMSH